MPTTHVVVETPSRGQGAKLICFLLSPFLCFIVMAVVLGVIMYFIANKQDADRQKWADQVHAKFAKENHFRPL